MKIRNGNIRKRAQEEIVGFVLIVVIVSIIFLVFLGIFIRQSPNELQKESREVYQFLESSMEYTTSCAISYEPAYSKLGELIRDCYSGSLCTSGKQACVVLNETLVGVLDSSWKVGPERAIKGYIFNATYSTNTTQQSILAISRGNCSFNRQGSEYLIPAFPGTIVSSLNLCY